MKKMICLLVFVAALKAYSQDLNARITETLRPVAMNEAKWALKQQPVTITAEHCDRSAGGRHDFYSEGDYWWPNPKSPDSPYIKKDGLTNPNNFVAHRQAMVRFSRIIGALATAYKITGNKKYIQQAEVHLNAWFIDPETRMNPNLLYAQAIKGVATGRGIGIIDAIQLMEVAQGTEVMQKGLNPKTLNETKAWFKNYLSWVTTHPYGKDEMNAKNNHGTCWVMQVACFAKFTDNAVLLNLCRDRYKQILLPGQMAPNGSFPLELERTKPFGYSIFDLDAMCTICQLLSDRNNNFWAFETGDGRSIKKGIAFLQPYLKNKADWPYPHDVMYWDEWPVAQPALVFGALAFHNSDWLSTWVLLNHAPQNEEVIRNLPVRHPLLWID